MNSIDLLGITFTFDSPVTGMVDLLSAFVPSFALYYFGKRSYMTIKSGQYESYLPGSAAAHILRLIAQVAIISLSFISIAIYISGLHSSDSSEQIYAPYIILLTVSSVNWIVALVLYTMEHQKLGDISINLRRLWLVNLICQAIGIIVTECLIIYEDSFGAVEGVNVAYLVILVLLVLHGALTKNSVGTESPSKLSVMYVPYKDLKTRANSFRSASFGMDNEHIESSADIMGKFLKFSQKQKVRASTAVGEADIKFSSPVEKKEVVAQPAENLAKPLLQNDDGATRTQSEITPRQKKSKPDEKQQQKKEVR